MFGCPDIAGYNPLIISKTPYSYYFARLGQLWGWATWRRAWKRYSFDVTDLKTFIQKKKINRIFNKYADRHYWLEIFKKMEKHEIDTWDYQWLYWILYNNGTCIIPARNLITNIGWGPNATHTFTNDPALNNKQRFEITEIIHPDKIIVNTYFVNKINKVEYGTNIILFFKQIIKSNERLFNICKRLLNLMIKAKRLLWYLKRVTKFIIKFRSSASLFSDNRFICRWEECLPCLFDATSTTGFDVHSVYHTAWAARVLIKTQPKRHVDIGSCLRFATLVSSFVLIDFYDYRPAMISLPGLNCGHADITKLPFDDNSIESLSSMHVVEHIGLERYGDPFDPQGDLKAMNELQRVVKKGGSLLFVVPIGEQMRIQ